jgi:hypothetical protein
VIACNFSRGMGANHFFPVPVYRTLAQRFQAMRLPGFDALTPPKVNARFRVC